MTEINTRRGRRPGVQSHTWSEADDDMLGRYPDAIVAEIVGVHPRAVESRRARVGVPAHSRPAYPLDETSSWVLGAML
jgi:hypothetical protein